MKWQFRRMSKSEVERDVTQRSHFDTDDARIEATLIRESHQNSLDAKIPSSTAPVKTRIRIFTPVGHEDYFDNLFSGLRPHLIECGIDLTEIDFRRPTFILLEDFGTTGLVGEWSDWDQKPFNDFWRREGRSHKTGASNGRWGLGKLVFSAASRIRTFFGLTIRYDDPNKPLFMGETVLATHNLEGNKYVPYGFYANAGLEGFQLPETDVNAVADFSAACGLARSNEPGFSVVIPYPIQQLEPKSLIEGVLRNYFFPILTGQLEVEIQGEVINAETFKAVAAKYADGMLSPELIDFTQRIDDCQKTSPDIQLSQGWASNMEASIDSAKIELLRTAFGTTNAVIHARAPITLRRKEGVSIDTHFDLFLRKATEGVRGDSLYIRSTITIPNESRYFNVDDTFGALHATDEAIAEFLGDAENPAHTQWNGSAERLKDRWKNGAVRLSEIRRSLKDLYRVLAQVKEQKEPDALIDFFSIDDLQTDTTSHSRKRTNKPSVPLIEPSQKAYRIVGKTGGFTVKPGNGLTEDLLPVSLRVRVAYDVLSGNALKKYDPLDFRLDSAPIKIDSTGAICSTPSPNSLEIEINDLDFSVDVRGFDLNRDLLVDARKGGK